METTRLSSKGQVIIPKNIRSSRHWETGLELDVIDTSEGVLLKPKALFEVSELMNVAGMLKARIQPKTDEEIQAALKKGIMEQWRDRS